MNLIKEVINEEYELNGIEIIFWQIPLLISLLSFFGIIIRLGI